MSAWVWLTAVYAPASPLPPALVKVATACRSAGDVVPHRIHVSLSKRIRDREDTLGKMYRPQHVPLVFVADEGHDSIRAGIASADPARDRSRVHKSGADLRGWHRDVDPHERARGQAAKPEPPIAGTSAVRRGRCRPARTARRMFPVGSAPVMATASDCCGVACRRRHAWSWLRHGR